jgi:Putative transposase
VKGIPNWVAYAKPPSADPSAFLEYLGRYTRRVAISNQRLLAMQDGQVSFRWKDYKHEQRPKTMTLAADEFIRRFLLHALPPGFRRIRYYGLFAHAHRREAVVHCRKLLLAPVSDLLPRPAIDYSRVV